MDRKQLGVAAQLCWLVTSILLWGGQARAQNPVPADLEFLEWLGASLDARDVGVDLDVVLADYEGQLKEQNDVNQGKESSQ